MGALSRFRLTLGRRISPTDFENRRSSRVNRTDMGHIEDRCLESCCIVAVLAVLQMDQLLHRRRLERAVRRIRGSCQRQHPTWLYDVTADFAHFQLQNFVLPSPRAAKSGDIVAGKNQGLFLNLWGLRIPCPKIASKCAIKHGIKHSKY